MDQGSPGNLSKGGVVQQQQHVHHEHSPGKLMGPDHMETVHASESFEKSGVVAAHLAALHDAHMLERGLLPGTQLPDSEAPPIAPVLDELPWKELRAVTLADMKVGKTHRRHVLQGRLCVTAYKIHSVVSVLEEDSGLATVLMLKNSVPLRASMAQAQHCFPEGSRVAIRDPYLTRFPDGLVGVLVEHPTDMVFLSRPAVTPVDRSGLTSPRHHESGVHKSSNDIVTQSPDSTHRVASSLVNAGVPQQGDRQKESCVIVDADLCKQNHHTDAQCSQEVEIPSPQYSIVEPQSSAVENVSTVKDLGAGTREKDKDVEEVKEEVLPRKDLDEAAQFEQGHVIRDAVTGVANGDIGETEVVSHPAVEDIKDEGSERDNVIEANESGILDRATAGYSDTSNSAQAGEVVSRAVVADSPEISSYESMAAATESEKCNVDSAVIAGDSCAKSLDDAADEVVGSTATKGYHADEVVGSTATKSYHADDAAEFQEGDGCREPVTVVLDIESNRSEEAKEEVVNSPVMEERNEILPSTNVDGGTEDDGCNEEIEDITGISKEDAEKTDDVKEVVSSSATKDLNEHVRSTAVEEGTDAERREEIEDKAGASGMEEEKDDEAKEVLSSLAEEECSEILPSTSVDEGTEDDRPCDAETEDITGHSEVEEKTDEVKEVVSNPAMEDSNEHMPNTRLGEGSEDESFDDIIKDKVGASHMQAEKSDEATEVVSGSAAEEDKLPITSMDEVDRHDEETADIAEASEVEANKSYDMNEVVISSTLEECSDLMSSTSADEGTRDVRRDEESKDNAGASEMEAERSDELKGVVSSLAVEDCNEILQSTNVDEGIEHVRHDEGSEDKVGVSQMEAERSDEVKKVVSSPAMEECDESLPSTGMDAGTEDIRHDEESEDRAAVLEVEAEKNGEKIVPTVATTKECDEIFPNLSVDEGPRLDEETGASVLQADKSNVAREIVSSSATEESNEMLASRIVDEGTGNHSYDEASEDRAGALEIEAAKSHGVKEVVNIATMEECDQILPSTSVDEDVMRDEETEDIHVASEVGEAKSDESKEVVTSPVVQESSGTLSDTNLVEAVESEMSHLDRIPQTGALNVGTSKYEETGEVLKPNSGEAQQEIDLSSTPKESFSAHALRLQGNKLFLHEDFRGATELYTRGILQAMKEQEHTRSPTTSAEQSGVTNGHASESEVLLGFSNCAEAWIRLHEYEKGLEDAEKALALQHDHLKSLFRKGRALLGLHQYHEANSILREAAPRAPSDKDLQAALHESIVRVQQSEMGLFDLSSFYLRGRYVGEFPSCTDYIGPIKVVEVGHGCGRGLVLKKHVEAGELLLVSNPIAFMEVQGFDHQTGVEVSLESINQKVQEAFAPICANPHVLGSDNQKLHMLFDGFKKLPAPPANLLTSNSRDRLAMAPLDASCIHHIIQLNAFNGSATIGWKNLPGTGDQENKVESWGLWWLPSFINHSCMPNSSQILVGRALLVFASRELQAGEEITRSYFDIFQPHQQRKDLSTKGWGFVCHCPRCKLEDALHTPLSQVTNHYTKLMELAARPKREKISDAKHADNQATAALRFSHELERKLKDLKLRAVEENWIRGSFVHFIDLITSEHELSPHLELVVEAMAAVCPGSESTLHMSVLAKDSAKHATGKKSVQFKSAHHRAMHICRCTYGKQKSSVLQALVDRDEH